MAVFTKVLVANRGEIAVRLIRALREMEIESVAIYSEADRDALHVRFADEAYCVGPPASGESYLVGDRIVEVASSSGAEAIHPGYGFLAENAAFANMVEEAGLAWIGPPPSAIELMGSKLASRKAAMDAGVPTIPGSEASLEEEAEVAAEAERLGYPVLLKADFGGGGKGMRVVASEEELSSALRAARSEAASAFGDPAIYVERAIAAPRHIEIQVLGDRHGNVIHLGERECSIQRRHQKVVEEAPSVVVDETMREAMGEAALRLCRDVGYYSCGTVEFLVDPDGEFYFLEMNTRLQVEHPVTEMITGIDLAKAMVRVAAGEELWLSQEDVSWVGHAIECRIYAEDPDNNFLPSPGVIDYYRAAGGPGVREDTGIYEGYEIPIYYDPIISKLITWGRDRNEAIERMSRALSEYVIMGIKTTIPFHQRVMRSEAFREGRLSTEFIDKILEPEAPPPVEVDEIAVVAAVLDVESRKGAFKAPEAPGMVAGAPGGGSAWKLAGRRESLRGW
ncbi:MAG: acetyl-CoA carboxylase biotin carboxylase subunit [bacterium]|nr:acetyl-CoA carboxylase biotin carboxylase subunit [bacterium]